MKIIKRKMQSDILKDGNNDFPYTQASFNSDGNITLRHYGAYLGADTNGNDGINDEIIVLSKSETQAIFELMCKIKNSCNVDLPF